MATINLDVYLFFDRTCSEAMDFYKDIFGGELVKTTRGSVDPTAPEDMKELLIHSDLTGGLVRLMGSDSVGSGVKPQERISLSLTGTDEPILRKVFSDLSADGKVVSALKTEFWGDTFGTLIDKYGITWMVTIGKSKD
jgi:PhnB protein